MNRGLNFYGIILLTIATILVFSLTDFGVVHATTGIDLDDNPVQSNQVPDLKSDPNDNEESTSNNNNNNDDNNDDTNNNNDDTNNNNNNNNNNNDMSSTSTSTSSTPTSTSTSSTPTSTSASTTTTTSNDNVPMSLPFNSNMADESDDETDYSSIIPFP
jgi:hypothetical protein